MSSIQVHCNFSSMLECADRMQVVKHKGHGQVGRKPHHAGLLLGPHPVVGHLGHSTLTLSSLPLAFIH